MFLVRRGGLPVHDDRNNGSEHGIHGGQHGIDGINGTDAGTDDVRTGAGPRPSPLRRRRHSTTCSGDS
ncbi:hypothetical protein BH24ACT6_BH24ACT6_08590 [soil metagenome]